MKMRITAEFVEKVMKEREHEEKTANLRKDSEEYLRALPYYKPRPEGGTTEEKPWTKDIILHNATIFVDSPYNMCHQGDITVETLKGIRERIKDHKVFIFWEHNPNKPICGPFDLTALNLRAQMAKPFGKASVTLEMADIILEGDKCIINYRNLSGLKENCERAGFNVEVNMEMWY